jgi:hypothetical protein
MPMEKISMAINDSKRIAPFCVVADGLAFIMVLTPPWVAGRQAG